MKITKKQLSQIIREELSKGPFRAEDVSWLENELYHLAVSPNPRAIALITQKILTNWGTYGPIVRAAFEAEGHVPDPGAATDRIGAALELLAHEAPRARQGSITDLSRAVADAQDELYDARMAVSWARRKGKI